MESGTKKALGWGIGITLTLGLIILIIWLVARKPKGKGGEQQLEGGTEGGGTDGGTSSGSRTGGGTGLKDAGRKLGEGLAEGIKKVGLGDLLGEEPAPDIPPPEFDPYNPTPTPVQGKAYVVKDGDNMDKILRAAGFTTAAYPYLYNSKKRMIEDPENLWIGEEGTGAARTLRLYHRFPKLPGKNYAWHSQYDASGHYNANLGYPVVRVIKTGEVQ